MIQVIEWFFHCFENLTVFPACHTVTHRSELGAYLLKACHFNKTCHQTSLLWQNELFIDMVTRNSKPQPVYYYK